MIEMILNKNPTGIVNTVIKMSYLEIFWEMQANAKKARRLKEIG